MIGRRLIRGNTPGDLAIEFKTRLSDIGEDIAKADIGMDSLLSRASDELDSAKAAEDEDSGLFLNEFVRDLLKFQGVLDAVEDSRKKTLTNLMWYLDWATKRNAKDRL